jgi:vancomycin permeability regulator SanA
MNVKLPSFIRKHQKLIITFTCCALAAPFIALAASFAFIAPYDKYVLSIQDVSGVQAKHVRVGMVMGAGITQAGAPYRELQARLDVAAQALRQKEVDKLILTGDNRFHNYDEPAAMQHYLVAVKHISKDKLQVDDAGRDTYASCERAAKIFGLQRTIIFSAGTHLPRAIFLCRSFGIEAYGIASNVEANNSHRREILARAKAVLNVYLWGEPTILGAPIKV